MAGYQRKGKKYSKITYQKRVELLDLILNQGQKITETAKKLHLKLPTVKVILSNYRKKNHIFQRKEQVLHDNQAVKQDPNQEIRNVNEDQQSISQKGVQKCQSNQNGLQAIESKLYQNDLNYSYSLWYRNMNLWGYLDTPFIPYQF